MATFIEVTQPSGAKKLYNTDIISFVVKSEKGNEACIYFKPNTTGTIYASVQETYEEIVGALMNK